MKMKSFAMLAVTGLLTASFAYIAPAMADDAERSTQALQAPTDNSMQSPTDLGPSTSQNDITNPLTTNPGADAGMPDTATGDDDY